nr:LysM peptidoglycan-binding domain-containing protein [Pseudomonadales bacterium]
MPKGIWNNKTGRTGLVLLLLVFLITGCAGLPPIYTVAGGTGTYVVRKGDSLYSIAFRYGLDYKSLARINGVRSPYTIYVDQLIRLRVSAKSPKKDSAPVATQSSTRPPSKVSKAPPAPSALVASWRWPLKGEVINRFSLAQPVNKGIDIAGNIGDTVRAAADGVVVYAGGNLRGYGQ